MRNIRAAIMSFIMLVVANGFAADRPGWRGPARDGHAPPGSVFSQSLPWVDGDRLLALVGDPDGSGVVCFDKFTGKVLWQSQVVFSLPADRPFGVPRSDLQIGTGHQS